MPLGRVSVFDRPGDAAVMVRFQGQVAVFRASVPLGVPVANLPPARNLSTSTCSPNCRNSASRRRRCATTRRSCAAYPWTSPAVCRRPTRPVRFWRTSDPNKRDKLIDYLLDSPGYGEYFANKWTMVLRNRRVPNNTAISFRFHDWVRRAIQQNMPYDQFVRNVLAGSGDVEVNPTVAWYTQVATPTEQVEDTAQLFLGMRIQCARCHHHPFERWDQNDYYSFQAFFSQVGTKPSRNGWPTGAVFHKGGVATARNPRTNLDVKPDRPGQPSRWISPAYEDPRLALVDWMTNPDNPFFAKALVNRYWNHFFGRGIIDPEDDMRVTNPPSNPELLDALARSTSPAAKYDLKELVRTICRSSTYQLSSEPNEFNQDGQAELLQLLSAAAERGAAVRRRQPGRRNQHRVRRSMPAGTRAVQLPDGGFRGLLPDRVRQAAGAERLRMRAEVRKPTWPSRCTC